MTTAQDHSVMRKKAEAGKSAADQAPMSAERAIGQALAKVAQDLLELPLQVRALSESRASLAELPELIDEFSLLAMLDGPQEGLGMFVLPPETSSALIEVQTMGNLGKSAAAPRRPTRIDAAMVADYLDAVLMMMEELLAADPAIVWAGGFRYASYLDDPRPLGLMLEDISYRVWTVELGFGAGAEREGKLLWVVPATGRGAKPRRLPKGEQSGPRSSAEDASAVAAAALAAAEEEWKTRLEATVMGAPAQLHAVLHRVTLPLSALLNFRRGSEIPVPEHVLENLRVEAVGRRLVAQARLGQQNGMRAVRILDADADQPAMRPATPKRADMNAGESPFPFTAPEDVPEMGTLGGLGDPNSAAYDTPDMGGLGGLDTGSLDMGGMEMGGLDGGGDDAGLGGLGGLDGFAPEGGDLPPLDLTLDGFGQMEDDPLKTGSDG